MSCIEETENTVAQISVELLTREGCHLCETARQTVSRVCQDFALTWEEIDISAHPELEARHGVEIPVLRINGEPKDFWRVSEKRMRKILTQLTQI